MQKQLGWCVSVLLAVAGCDPAPVTTDAGPADTGTPPVDAGQDAGPIDGCSLSGYPALDLQELHQFSDVPTAIAIAPGRDEIFVALRGGEVRIMDATTGELTTTPFLDIGPQLGGMPNGADEWGLLGIAFHPGYATNGLLYIAYTADLGGATYTDRVAVVSRSTDDPDHADSGTIVTLIETADPRPNHNGGILQFGPDGLLYYGLGDGGEQGDPSHRGQNTMLALGKIHRIAVGPGIATYDIPPGNPFADGTAGLPTIWAYGFRNPWRFSFDRANGDMYIGDVGQDQWEEVDFVAAGTGAGDNFGWSVCEGTHPFNFGDCAGLADHHGPIFEYSHGDDTYAGSGSGSITGGFVYRGSTIPALTGAYLFGDYTSSVYGALRYCDGETREPMPLDIANPCAPATFGEDADGEMLVGCIDDGTVRRIIAP
jgi:glucose/arabinose dehydrogenase